MKLARFVSLSVLIVLGLLQSLAAYSEPSGENANFKNDRIEAAVFDSKGNLLKPKNIDEWIFLGASVGHGYPEEGSEPFSLHNPGLIQVVQMEPKAYEYFKKNRRYANGTMLSLSFYNTQEKPMPKVNGVVQADIDTFEIHLIDRKKYKDTRAFYLYQSNDELAAMIPEGNACVECHNSDAKYDGTFTQFYPIVRDYILKTP